MPTYQYACPDCDYEFETQQRFTDKPLKKCPRCGKRRIHRVITNVAVTFKGSGWYITDSKKADEAKRGKAKGAAVYDGDHKETVTASEPEPTSASTSAHEASKSESAEKASESGSGSEKSETKSSKKDKKA